MAKIVVGKGIYSGDYQGVKFSKITFIVEDTAPKKFGGNFEGSYTEQITAPDTPENRSVKLGDEINVYYNKYGKVDAVFVCKE